MKTFYLFRHGITYWSKNEIPYGLHEETAEILDEGKPTILNLAQYLKKQNIIPDIALSSEYLRVRQTTELVTQVTRITFQVDHRLNELREEGFDEFAGRLRKFTDWCKESEYNSFIICTHGACLAGLKYLILEDNFERRHLYDYPKSGVLQIIENSKLSVLDFNTL